MFWSGSPGLIVGEADFLYVNSIDRWIGGVELTSG